MRRFNLLGVAGGSGRTTGAAERAVAAVDSAGRPEKIAQHLRRKRLVAEFALSPSQPKRVRKRQAPFELRLLQPSRSFPLSTFATHCSSLMRSSWMGVLLGTDAQEVGGFFLDVCRPCGDCEGEVGREGGRDGVFGDGGEVVKQGVEAVDGETIVGSAGGLLGEGGGRSL